MAKKIKKIKKRVDAPITTSPQLKPTGSCEAKLKVKEEAEQKLAAEEAARLEEERKPKEDARIQAEEEAAADAADAAAAAILSGKHRIKHQEKRRKTEYDARIVAIKLEATRERKMLQAEAAKKKAPARKTNVAGAVVSGAQTPEDSVPKEHVGVATSETVKKQKKRSLDEVVVEAVDAAPKIQKRATFDFLEGVALTAGEDASKATGAKASPETGGTQKSAISGGTKPQRGVSGVGFKICVGGLHWEVGEDMVRKDFSECGEITGFSLLHGRGFAFIAFATEAGMDAALAYNGSYYAGRTIKVTRAREREDRLNPIEGPGEVKNRIVKSKGKGKDKSKW